VEDVFSAYGETEIADASSIELEMEESTGRHIDVDDYIAYWLDWRGKVCNLRDSKYYLCFYVDETTNYVKEIYFSYK